MRRRLIPILATLTLLWATAALAQSSAPSQPLGPDATGQSLAASEQVVIHFFVVPRVLPGGKEAAGKFPELRKFLAKTAGGYTQLGSCDGGALMNTGEVRTETNICYLVSASRDMSGELAAYLKSHFETKSPFILTWSGNRH